MTQQQIFQKWFTKLGIVSGGLPARGSVAACLVVLERLRKDFVLDLNAHRAKGGAQLQGLSSGALKPILARYGETRVFLGEGGRTNRGGPAAVESMFDLLREMNIDDAGPARRTDVIDALQSFLVEKVKAYHERKRLSFVYDPALSTRAIVFRLLFEADAVGKAAPVSQYLVGAKLQRRFPNIEVSNDRCDAADASSGRYGDFLIGDTAFHVTISPSPGHFAKCKANLEAGKRVFLLVPENKVIGARQNAELVVADRIAVESIESFVGTNVEELSVFGSQPLIGEFRQLLELYNKRVAEIEVDRSILIEIPPNLK